MKKTPHWLSLPQKENILLKIDPRKKIIKKKKEWQKLHTIWNCTKGKLFYSSFLFFIISLTSLKVVIRVLPISKLGILFKLDVIKKPNKGSLVWQTNILVNI